MGKHHNFLQKALAVVAFAVLTACGGGGGSNPSEVPNTNNLAPANVKLMEVSSNAVGTLNASWLAATDDATPAGNITYELHASESATFTPSESTRLFSGKGITSAEITQGVKPGVRYYVVLRALDGQGASASSAPLDVTVSNTAATPVAAAVVQSVSANQINQLSPSQVVLQAGVTAPAVGGFIASTEANNGSGFLRKVTAVTSGSGGVVVSTAPASVNEVYSDLRIASTFNLDTVPAEVASNASQIGVLVRSASADASIQTLEWPQSRFRYSTHVQPSRNSAVQAGLVVTDGFRATDDKSEYGSGKWGQVTGESRIELEAGGSGEMALSLFVTSNDKPLTSSTKVTVCKVDVGEVSNEDDKARKDLLSVTTGTFTPKETLIDSVPRITHAEQVIRFEAKEGADAAKPYRVVATAYFDDAGDGCNGASLGFWREAIEFEFDVYVTADSFPSQEATEEEFSSSANFKIRNRVVTTFSPKLVFDKEIANSKLSSAKILVSARPKVEQTLTINADAQATVNATRTVLKKRDFRKIYVTPAGIPIVISGSFQIDLKIEGEATGKMTATERLEIGYDEVTFGVEYVNGQFQPVKSASPVYELKIAGEANAQANLKLTLLPSLELTAYEVLTGNVVLAPYMQATAGIEGKVSLDARVDFEADRLRTAADADYRLTAARLQGGLDTYLYADLSVWDFTLAKYPNKDAEKGKYDTYRKVTLIDDTTLMDLPVLSVQVPELASGGASAAHPTDTRALKIVAIAANVPNPLHALFPGLPASYTPWRAWTAPKIVDQIDIDKSTYRVVGDGAEWSDVAWATFTVPGTYTLRVGGYSAWGPWARQYVETSVEIKDDNANTIMDYWEDRYALQGTGDGIAQDDPDSDGRSNLREWQDGTDPLVPDNLGTLNVSNTTPGFGEAIQVWLADVWAGVTNVVFSFTDTVVSVINGATERVSAIFSTTGIQTITATLQDAIGDTVGTLTQVITVGAPNVSAQITTVQDDSATPATDIANNSTTEDATPVIRGTIGAPLPAGFEVRLFKDGETDSFGVATVEGLNWSFAVPADQPLSNGAHSITAGVVRAVDGSTAAGPRSAPYSFTVQAVGVFGVTPTQVMRAKSTVFTFSGQGLPTSGLTITAPGNTRNTCQINAAGNSATGFNATCSFFALGAQTLQISQGSRVLGTLELDVTSNITDVTWASGSSTTFGKGTVKFGEMVTYRVSGEHLLVDTNLGFAVERCGVANTEIGTGTDVLRTYQCWFNNEAGAVAGQMSGVVKDAPNGQALYNFQVPVETAPIDANSSIVVSWDLGSVGTPIQGRGTNPRTVAINAGVEIEGFLNNAMVDVDVSNDRVRLFNFRNYSGYPGSAVFDASAFNGLVLRVPSGASWTFTSASVGSANTLNGLTASRLDAQAQRLAINLAGLGYDASTVVEVAYSRNASGNIELPATAFVRGVSVALSTNGYGADTLMNAPPYSMANNSAEWDFSVPTSGVYELYATYASAESRSVAIAFNGVEVFPNALAATTGGLFPTNRQTLLQGVVWLNAGANVMRVSEVGQNVFPHIKGFVLVPKSAGMSLSGDFSVARNPNGVWSYGWSPSLDGTFVLFDNQQPTPGYPAYPNLNFWSTPLAHSLFINKNANSSALTFATATYPAQSVNMHPGSAGQVAMARWTAPTAGTFLLNAEFIRADNSTVDVHVRVNGRSVFTSALSVDRLTATTSQSVSLRAGQTVDFVVGNGGNDYTFDSTTVVATIALVGAP